MVMNNSLKEDLVAETQDTEVLELESLQLDIKTLRQEREEDRKEFYQFTDTVNKNFASIQRNFKKIQVSLQKLNTGQSTKDAEEEQEDPELPSGQGSTVVPLGCPKQLPNNKFAADKQDQATARSTVLVDKTTGKELNLDGTPKGPCRHPNHTSNRQDFHTPQQQQGQLAKQVMTVEEIPEDQPRRDLQRARPNTPDVRRNLLSVKPAKLNIAEFEGSDADSWIQNIEQYFDAARTPLEQRTEFDVS